MIHRSPSSSAPSLWTVVGVFKLFYWLLFLLLILCSALAADATDDDDDNDSKNTKSIVVLIPGDAASMLQAQFHKPTVPHVYCARSTRGSWQTVWTPPSSQFLPGRVDCWTDTLTLRVVQTNETDATTNSSSYSIENGPGIQIRSVPGEAGLQLLDENGEIDNVYADLLTFLKETTTTDVHVATYDFRWSPAGNYQFVQELKQMIEDAYHRHNKNTSSQQQPTKVTIISHSLGALWAHYLLTHDSITTQAWKDQYIHAWIPISPAYGGAVLDLQQLVSGLNVGIAWLPPRVFLPQQRSHESNVWLLPAPQLYGDQPLVTLYQKRRNQPSARIQTKRSLRSTNATTRLLTFSSTKDKNNNDDDNDDYEIAKIYTAQNYSQLFADAGYDNYPIYDERISHLTLWNTTTISSKGTNSTTTTLQDPEVPVWPIYGGDQPTVTGYRYYDSLSGNNKNTRHPSDNPQRILTERGDSTITETSLTAGNGWRGVRPWQIRGQGHNSILSSQETFQRIQTVLSLSSSRG